MNKQTKAPPQEPVGGDAKQIYEEIPVGKHDQKGLSHYLGLFAGEHVAGTEFAVGAVFVTWGVTTVEFLQGLIIGNLVAVLLWTFMPALLATKTRQTLYAHLKRVCGPTMQKIFNIVSGIVYCTMGGAMITIAASAVRILFNIPPQVGLYPTNFLFVLLVLAIGAVVTVVAAYGFDGVSRFSGVCAPWLLVVFIMGGMLALPRLISSSELVSGIGGLRDFITLGDELIWMPAAGGLGRWHVAAFAIFCNLSLHMGLNDMAIFRYAKSYKYGYSVSIGVFFGHFVAWICSCMMGAATAALLQTGIAGLDTGDISYTIMGSVGLLAVVIAGWTTSNPNIYRAGLAFQSVFNRVPVRKVTLVTGAMTSVIACFPFIFSKLNEYVNIIGLAVAPVGAIVICDHFLLPRLGMTTYWSYYRRQSLNRAAILSWIGGLVITCVLGATGIVDFYFLFIPCFLSSCLLYTVLSRAMGAKGEFSEERAQLNQAIKNIEDMHEREYQAKVAAGEVRETRRTGPERICLLLSGAMLAVCFTMALLCMLGRLDLEIYRSYAIIPTALYFLFAILYSNLGKRRRAA